MRLAGWRVGEFEILFWWAEATLRRIGEKAGLANAVDRTGGQEIVSVSQSTAG